MDKDELKRQVAAGHLIDTYFELKLTEGNGNNVKVLRANESRPR